MNNNNLYSLRTTPLKAPLTTSISAEQKAMENLIRILRNSMNLRAKTLLTATNSPVYEYFDKKRPNYRILKGGQTGLFPIFKQNIMWGLIQVQSYDLIDRPKAQKILKAINELLIPNLSNTNIYKPLVCDNINVFLNCHDPNDRIKIALEILDKTSKSNMVYWDSLKPAPSRVGELYELSDTLIFISELFSLTPEQRKLISLYMNLPDELKGAQLVLSSSYSFTEIKKLLHDESLFIDTLSRYRFDVTQTFSELNKDEFFKSLSQTILSATTYSHLY